MKLTKLISILFKILGQQAVRKTWETTGPVAYYCPCWHGRVLCCGRDAGSPWAQRTSNGCW